MIICVAGDNHGAMVAPRGVAEEATRLRRTARILTQVTDKDRAGC